MKKDESFPHRVSIARRALGLTQGQLADMAGVVRRQIAAYEAGDSKPRDQVLRNLAAALGTTTEWLSIGMGKGPDVRHIKRTVTVREIPVLSWVQAIYTQIDDLWVDGSVSEFIPAPINAGMNSFAIRIEGDSMDSSAGISFPSGTIVIFDPDITPQIGDFILCVLDSTDEATFKKLISDQGRNYLKSINPLYPLIEISHEIRVLGVAFHAQTDLLKIDSKIEWKHIDILRGAYRDIPHPNNDSISNRLSEMEAKLDVIMDILNKR